MYKCRGVCSISLKESQHLLRFSWPHWMMQGLWSGDDGIVFANYEPNFHAVDPVTIPREKLMEHA